MKKSSFIIAAVFLFAVSSPFQAVNAQEKTPEEKEKELQEVIVEQKKAMIDQQKAQEEMQKVFQEHNLEINQAMEKAREKMNDPEYRKAFRIYEDFGRNKPFTTGEPFLVNPSDFNFNFHYNGDVERTTWDFSKSVKESSFSRDYVFDVEPTAKSVVMSVSGDCKAGEIRIKIVMPNGKTFSEIVLDEFGNLNWRKTLNITETENKDKAGAWKFEIKSSKASGYFKIFFQTS